MNPRTRQIEEHAPDMVVIQSTYLNNFWVVGSPDGTYGYYDEQCIADFEKDRLNDPDYVPGANSLDRSIEANIQVSVCIAKTCLFIYQ